VGDFLMDRLITKYLAMLDAPVFILDTDSVSEAKPLPGLAKGSGLADVKHAIRVFPVGVKHIIDMPHIWPVGLFCFIALGGSGGQVKANAKVAMGGDFGGIIGTSDEKSDYGNPCPHSSIMERNF